MRARVENVPVVIMSAERRTETAGVNALRTLRLQEMLDRAGIPWKEARGVWQGQRETSLIVLCQGAAARRILRATAVAFDQDAILYVDRARKARLWHRDGRVTSLGRLVASPVPPPEGVDGYTVVDGTYYYAVPR